MSILALPMARMTMPMQVWMAARSSGKGRRSSAKEGPANLTSGSVEGNGGLGRGVERW
jgi:hypothetical protein